MYSPNPLCYSYEVWVLADGVSSRFPQDRLSALRFLRSKGVVVTTVEAAFCEMVRGEDYEKWEQMKVKLRTKRKMFQDC